VILPGCSYMSPPIAGASPFSSHGASIPISSDEFEDAED